MANLKSSSSSRSRSGSVHLIPVVLLIFIAMGGVNCDITVINRPLHNLYVFEITSAAATVSLAPQLEITFPISVSVCNFGIAPAPEVIFIGKYKSVNSTSTGAKEHFTTLWVYNNATVTFFETAGETNFTTARVGFTVDYPKVMNQFRYLS